MYSTSLLDLITTVINNYLKVCLVRNTMEFSKVLTYIDDAT